MLHGLSSRQRRKMRRRGVRIPYVHVHSPFFDSDPDGNFVKVITGTLRLGDALRYIFLITKETDDERRMVVSIILQSNFDWSLLGLSAPVANDVDSVVWNDSITM